MPFSNAYANELLDYTLGKVANISTAPTNIYIGLSSNDPEADGGTFNELSGNAYARVLVSIRNQTYPDLISRASDREIKNIKQVNWNKATGDWGTPKGFGLFSQETGGSPFFYGKLDSTDNVSAGAVALFDPGAFKISFPTKDSDDTDQ